MKELIVIDDTGSPGNSSESKTLKSDRYSLTAVLIHSSRRNILEMKIRDIIFQLQQKHPNVKELHFTDIINRRFTFADLNSEEVISIFKDIAQILEQEEFYIFHQTITPRTLSENGIESITEYLDPSRRSIEFITLDFLCSRIKTIIEPFNIENLFEVIVDVGVAKIKKNQKIHLPFFKNLLTEPYAQSESSDNYLLLQIADFYAFSINRMQMLMIKDKRSDFDKSILEILQLAFKNKGFSGISPQLIDPHNISKEQYDSEILKKFQSDGNLESWKRTNEKE